MAHKTIHHHGDIFPSISVVNHGHIEVLKARSYLNKNATVVCWTRLSDWMKARDVSEQDAKMLIVIELDQPSPRYNLVKRLVNYISYSSKEDLMNKINNSLNKQ